MELRNVAAVRASVADRPANDAPELVLDSYPPDLVTKEYRKPPSIVSWRLIWYFALTYPARESVTGSSDALYPYPFRAAL